MSVRLTDYHRPLARFALPFLCLLISLRDLHDNAVDVVPTRTRAAGSCPEIPVSFHFYLRLAAPFNFPHGVALLIPSAVRTASR
jgi:hypothetical protein